MPRICPRCGGVMGWKYEVRGHLKRGKLIYAEYDRIYYCPKCEKERAETITRVLPTRR